MLLSRARKEFLQLSTNKFGPMVGTDGRAIRRYERGEKPTPWTVQSKSDRLVQLDKHLLATSTDGKKYVIRVHPPGLYAEVQKRGTGGYAITILAWTDPTPPNPDTLKLVVEELKAYWNLRCAMRGRDSGGK
jgi:hypothetical protein